MSGMYPQFEQFGPNSGYVQELFQLFQTDPTLVPDDWRRYFASVSGTPDAQFERKPTNGNGHHAAPASNSKLEVDAATKANELVNLYRQFGHVRARSNPVARGVRNPKYSDALSAADEIATKVSGTQEVPSFGFSNASTISFAALRESLEQIYCRSVGFEFSHLLEHSEKEWLRNRIESARPTPSAHERLAYLSELIKAEGLENELHRTFVGAKRFSLQGGETLMPLLNAALDSASSKGLTSVIVGMAHRGRLNVLTHLAGKPYEVLCAEFEDKTLATLCGAGDVKYHLGFKGKKQLASGNSVTVELVPNPSHLEFVNPVVEGVVRAIQDRDYDRKRQSVLPLLIHGDAAFIGQGIVWETLNFALVDGYRTGGSLHVVINNQVGFTTYPEESRGSLYCSDLAKGIYAPVFHVNAEDVEACCWVAKLAAEYRQEFGKDVVIDLICYRKYGHNEGDDPNFTQPVLYSEINAKETIASQYGKKLVSEALLTDEEVKKLWSDFTSAFKAARAAAVPLAINAASPLHGKLWDHKAAPAVSESTIEDIAQSLITYPDGFAPHPKLVKILEKRVETLRGGKTIDWGFAEGLAFGSLVHEGKRVRLSGQDCGRGTFSQRHLMLRDHESQEFYLPLNRISKDKQPLFEVYNSTLSEASVMGFEFGFSYADSDSLVLWEGQFGDFANGAQVIIDQFLANSESKWGQRSGLVLLLPHGFEGQGPEHSSARLERYLQLSAEGNWTVAHPTEAKQHFHLLRRQAHSRIKRPLVVMTPKSLLRSTNACSSLEELTNGKFEEVISTDSKQGAKVEHLVLCSGKVFYDLWPICQKAKGNVRVLRLEQLYPFPAEQVAKLVSGAKSATWVQEEPENAGAWRFIKPYLDELKLKTEYVGRPASASPATGSGAHSAKEMAEFLAQLEVRIR